MTFGQRIELGRILSEPELSEYERFRQSMLCIDPTWNVADMKEGVEYFDEVLDGILFWINREKTELKYNPSADELAAGIEVLSLRVGEMSTIMALAKDYSKDPDEILEWKYGKVFNILFTNLQSFLYRDRLERRLTEKAKAKAMQGRRGKR